MGFEFFKTRMGKDFYDHTMKGIFEEMKSKNTLLQEHNSLLNEQNEALRKRNNIESQKIIQLTRQNTILLKLCEKMPSDLDSLCTKLPEAINLLCKKVENAII